MLVVLEDLPVVERLDELVVAQFVRVGADAVVGEPVRGDEAEENERRG